MMLVLLIKRMGLFRDVLVIVQVVQILDHLGVTYRA